MALTYELGLDILKMYLRNKNEVSRSFFRKLEHEQDRHTDRHTYRQTDTQIDRRDRK